MIVALGLVAAACGGGGDDSSSVEATSSDSSEPADDTTSSDSSEPADETTSSDPSEPADDTTSSDSSEPVETTEAVIPEDASTEIPETAPNSDLPAVDVLDVNSGGVFNLANLAPNDKPVLLWFWAPH